MFADVQSRVIVNCDDEILMEGCGPCKRIGGSMVGDTAIFKKEPYVEYGIYYHMMMQSFSSFELLFSRVGLPFLFFFLVLDLSKESMYRLLTILSVSNLRLARSSPSSAAWVYHLFASSSSRLHPLPCSVKKPTAYIALGRPVVNCVSYEQQLVSLIVGTC